MSGRALIANMAWGLSCLPAYLRFRAAIARPAQTQASILRRLVHAASQTAFGREHHFEQIRDYHDFASRVPIRDYGEFEPYIDRIRRGEQGVLSPEPVIRLATTSGTTSGRKLIPYTRRLQQEFNSAIGPWIVDLFHSDPLLMTGPAYWSISPAIRDQRAEDSAVPIGFEEDGEYLGGITGRLINWAMAVPASVRHAADIDEFRANTLAELRRQPGLRLISVWHPSFLSLLIGDAVQNPLEIWPGLRVISCWADARAKIAAKQLEARFPDVRVQPKGLIATEAIISIPFGGQFPLSISSHFLEFIDEKGVVHLSHELMDGALYDVVVTTGGGLWRYRLNDRVRVEGFLGQTPSIRFVGKSGNISDLFGEKLSETFVSQILDQLHADGEWSGTFAMVAPEGNSYVFYIEGHAAPSIRARLDRMLRENPHYSYCRDLGQLGPTRIFKIRNDANEAMLLRLSTLGQRLGDIKPTALSRLGDWQNYFEGQYVDELNRGADRGFTGTLV